MEDFFLIARRRDTMKAQRADLEKNIRNDWESLCLRVILRGKARWTLTECGKTVSQAVEYLLAVRGTPNASEYDKG